MLDFAMLAQQCAPDVAPVTLAAVVKVESGFDPLAINVNGGAKLARKPRSVAEAVATAERLLQAGASIDVGLGQINSANFARTGLTLPQLFEPCANLRAASTILLSDYQRHAQRVGSGQTALTAALSTYNTGSPTRGVANGYVGKVSAAAMRLDGQRPQVPVVPAIAPGQIPSPIPVSLPPAGAPMPAPFAARQPVRGPTVAAEVERSLRVFASGDDSPSELVFR